MPELSATAPAEKIGSREPLFAALLILGLFLANLSIASRSPFGGWMDEVFMVEPGLNLAAGTGWKSSTWFYQTDREFWAQNSPLYPAALSVWVRAFGISMASARAYCYFIGAIGTFLFWLGTYRFKLMTPGYRLFWIVFLTMQYSTNWMMRNERYDVWIFCGLGMAWAGATLRNPLARYSVIFLGCYLCPWAGLISMTYLYLLAGLVTLLSWFRFWKETATAVAGALCGMFSLFGFYKLMGVWEPFWKMVHTLTLVGGWYHFPQVFRVFLFVRGDYGITLMLGVLAVLTVIYRKNLLVPPARWLGLGWGIAILLPCIMVARGMFPTMYFYMMVVPLSLAIFVALSASSQLKAARCLAIILGVICLGGLPLRMYFAAREWDYRDPGHLREFVRAHVKPGDHIFADYLFYFEVRDYAQWYSAPSYAPIIPADEAARVNVALVNDADFPNLVTDASPMKTIGGGWEKVAVFPPPDVVAGLRRAPRVNNTYTLYRRSTPQPAP